MAGAYGSPVRKALGPTLLVLVLGAATTAACTRTAQDKAAQDAQDACIVALEPVAQGRTVTPDQVTRAREHADAAAEADERWTPLKARVEQLGTAATPEAVDALTVECRRVNDIVRGEQDRRRQ